jgi:hypothetical protein
MAEYQEHQDYDEYEYYDEPSRSRTWLVVAIVVVVVLLCCCCLALVAGVGVFGQDILDELGGIAGVYPALRGTAASV